MIIKSSELKNNLNNNDLMNPIDKIENEEMIKLKDEIESLNINDITPVQALSILNEIKNKYNIEYPKIDFAFLELNLFFLKLNNS